MAFRPPGKGQADPGSAVLGDADVAAGAQSDTAAVVGAHVMAGACDGKGRAAPVNAEPNDRGAGTVTALAICMVLLGLSVVALVMVQASVAAVRAATAADLAALAGADALRGLPLGTSAGMYLDAGGSEAGNFDADDGLGAGTGAANTTGDACGVAREVAARNTAALRGCTADPGSGTVTVETEVQVPALPVPAVARARAGPPG
ncbi:hypothetical protein NNX28_03860 [Arthrobacter sp. zg-Y859]|uniref:Flp pilus-assembly TadG-like N-terminal domain-containing protein n=1 Tax=Arthrobacter jinronghuae TaxID=2964609 RepID=A0ABT1NQN5_9MICC|nr:hypothetical protein [Arthrobacter jinronghuae]MCQ1949064.1 hypothetical protein [Arthrobacter jinronghuae]UWX78141.1 hypothetical protein N2K98_14405 [Arthrobacter jinronghuae]